MVEYKLADFVRENSQARAAQIIGCTQSAVSQMLRTKRDIYIVSEGTKFSHYEKKIPGQKAA